MAHRAHRDFVTGIRLILSVAAALYLALNQGIESHAEIYVAGYGGVTQSRSTDVTASTQSCFALTCASPVETTRSVGFKSGPVAGVRGGYWFQSLRLAGFAGDVSYYRVQGAGLDIDVLPLSLLALGRLSLFPSREAPRGRIQPYVGLGPSLAIQRASADFRPSLPNAVSGWSLAPAWDARAGVALTLSARFSLFSEWRMIQQRVEIRNSPLWNLGAQERLSTTLTTQHLVVGIAVSF